MEELCRRIAAAEWRIIMKISEILKSEPITISMEVFPPKSDVKLDSVRATVREIARLKPAFVSCTYGAGGGTSRYTVEISQDIMEEGVASMAHLTCISSTRDSVHDQIARIKEAGIQNILALRGDIPAGMDFPSPRYYEHAIQLVEEIRRDYPEACIGGACYPEKHPDAFNKDEDIRHIKDLLQLPLSPQRSGRHRSDPCRYHARHQPPSDGALHPAFRLCDPARAHRSGGPLRGLSRGYAAGRNSVRLPPDHRSDCQRLRTYPCLYNE